MLKITSKYKHLGLLAQTAIFALAGLHSAPGNAEPAMAKKVLLEKKVELPDNKFKARMIRVTFPPGFKTPWHTHRGPGPRYVVKGELKIIEEGHAKTYSAGEVFWESGKRMSAENLTDQEAEVVIFELRPF